ncbi:hypothetical protein EDB80DRAFT_574123, partial [Ilyonectria destructans]
QVDPSRPYDVAKCGSPAGGLFHVLTHYNWETGEVDEYFDGPGTTFQEPVFIPESADAPEGHGYLLALMNRLDELRNDIWLVASIKLPLKFKLGFHGNWVDRREIDEFKKAREDGSIAPALPAQKPLLLQLMQ